MTGRRDPSAREAIQYAADAGTPVPVSAYCLRHEHHACPLDARDARGHVRATCQCPCHQPGGWGEPEPTRHDRPTTRPVRHEPRTNL